MPLVEEKSPTRRKLRERIAARPVSRALPDAELVRSCLRGDENAWPALIDKYKSLIYSIPLKYRLSPDDAADIFQSVCVELLSELPNVRRPEALPKWIIQVTAHKCLHHKQQVQRFAPSDEKHASIENSEGNFGQTILKEADEEQAVRSALNALPERCRKLIEMLFFEEPVRSYQEIAADLGLATGSIGFIRQRCLARMRKQMREAGLE